MKKFNFGIKGWGIIIFCFFLFWVGSGCPVTSLNIIMEQYNQMYGWDVSVLNGFGTVANLLSIVAAALFGWWCKKKGPKMLIFAGCVVGALSMFMWGRYDFDSAWTVVFILNTLVRSFGFVLVGSLSAITGSFTSTFIGLIICSAIGAILMMLCSKKPLGRTDLYMQKAD